MTARREVLVRLLADGREHSGEALATALNVSRAAVWKQIQTLGEWGLTVQSVPRRGYRLDRALDLYDVDVLSSQLASATRRALHDIRVVTAVASTNSELLAGGPPPPGQMGVCLAEFQSAGRGRRGRSWLAPLGSGLCMSLSWCFPTLPAQISCLALAIGAAIARALEDLGVPRVALKWPNDLWVDGKKLGGILVEMRAEAAGPAFVVIGAGVNHDLPDATRDRIRREGSEAIDLRETCGSSLPTRTAIAVAIANECHAALRRFESAGFEPFLADWRRRDALLDCPILVLHPGREVHGIARGIDVDGALLVETPAGMQRQVSGEVSVRRSPD